MADFLLILKGGVIAAVAWFLIGSILYMNPAVAKLYKNQSASKSIRKWSNQRKRLILMFLSILVQSLLAAYVYILIKSVFGDSVLSITVFFGLIVAFVKVVPRFLDMWMTTNYPGSLLAIELVNGVIGGFLMALVFGIMI